jgi:hypothetical protein
MEGGMRRTLWFLGLVAVLCASRAPAQTLTAEPGSIVAKRAEAYLAAVESPGAAEVLAEVFAQSRP